MLCLRADGLRLCESGVLVPSIEALCVHFSDSVGSLLDEDVLLVPESQAGNLVASSRRVVPGNFVCSYVIGPGHRRVCRGSDYEG